jgi:hypothetical protein
MLDNIRNIVLILTPIATLLLAFFTINKWKKEYKAKMLFDCSFKFLKSAFTLRDLFMSMRSPLIYAGEMLPKTTENKENYERENMAYYLSNRYTPFRDALNNFYSVFPEVEALMGKDVIKVAWDINHIVTKYNMAVTEYIQLRDFTNNYDRMAEISGLVFSNQTPDKLEEEMHACIQKIETATSKYLLLKM